MGSVLLIDDDPAFADSMQELVATEFPEVTLLWAANADQATALLQQRHDVRLILSDLMLEDANGIDVLEDIADTHAEPYRVMVTAYPDFRVAVDAVRRARVDYFMTKPVCTSEFQRVIAASMA